MFSDLRIPVIVAPMAGGPSTPELVAAAADAGAFGFLAGGMLTPEKLVDQIGRTRSLTDGPFGVNLFVPRERVARDMSDYRDRMRTEGQRYGTEPGSAVWDDDNYPAKLDAVVASRVPVVSFTFQLPSATDTARVKKAGSSVVITVATPEEGRQAAALGADAICVQGCDAGGHRGTFTDSGVDAAGGELYGVLAVLRNLRAELDIPVIAAGGLVNGADVAAVLSAGAVAAQMGSAFLRATESGTSPVYRDALAKAGRGTRFTRAFTGRPARGLMNRFISEHSAYAPVAYPQLHHMTKPIRAAATEAGDPEAMSLWAGRTYQLAEEKPAAEIIASLAKQARDALDVARDRL
ncbi:nitronate monooxygenase [Haloechinothrix sp. YIM 98757]|uniref:Propionate 3-nitronate monooxygenase n=1 Tax=Haloechinothrix aidingensis TaxID=2752311 RepID=A0A838AAK6_9PSEU|nr:nitronate monooxygenase [Haloechinothrix aidingensis]MBA0126258.1 nitronate monooxygenase [Haloechinothrix aidingensis]